MTTKTPLLPLAIDPGASKLLAYAPPPGPGAPMRTAFQSAHVAPVTHTLDGDDGLGDENSRPLCIEAPYVPPLFVGDRAPRWGTPVDALDFERFTGTPEMRGLLYATLTTWLRQHGPLTGALHVALALPNGARQPSRKRRHSSMAVGRAWLDGGW